MGGCFFFFLLLTIAFLLLFFSHFPQGGLSFLLIHAYFLCIKVIYPFICQICCNCISPGPHLPFKLVYGKADLFVFLSCSRVTFLCSFLCSQMQFSFSLWFLEQKEPRFRADVDLPVWSLLTGLKARNKSKSFHSPPSCPSKPRAVPGPPPPQPSTLWGHSPVP